MYSNFENRSFQIIIDNGSHLPSDIIKTFNNLWRNLKDGGFYIIEDLACTHNEAYCRKYMKKFHNIDLDEEFVERNKFINFINSLIMDMDLESNDIEFINFYKQCCIIKKK